MTAGEAPSSTARIADRVTVTATTAFLFIAPIAASSGWRTMCLLVAAFALGILAWRRSLRFAAPPRALLLAFGAWAAIALLSWTWSAQPAYTRSEIKTEVLYGALAFGVFFLAARSVHLWRPWCIAILAGTALIALLAALQRRGLPLGRHLVDGGPGPFSTHLVMVAAVLPALVFRPPWGLTRGTLALAVALTALFAAAWATGNRIVWPSLLVVFVVALFAGRALDDARIANGFRLRALVAAAGIVITVAFAASVAERTQMFFHQEARFTGSLERDIRPKLWGTAWASILEAPWFGHGFGREIIPERFLPITPAGENHPPMRHAHNAFLSMAIQVGVAGLAAFLVLLALLVREYLRLLKQPRIAPLGVMGLALVTGFVVKNLTDDFVFRHNALMFWALNGVLLGLARVAPDASRPSPRAVAPPPSAAAEPETDTRAPSA